jgi:tetratricopeptide (TPR) repeat protein
MIFYGIALAQAGRGAAVLDTLAMMDKLSPNDAILPIARAGVLQQMGRWAEAREVLKAPGAANLAFAEAILGFTEGKLGNRAEAVRLARDLEEKSKRQYISPDYVALPYMGLGDRDMAFRWLDRAYDVHVADFGMTNLLFYDPIRDDPRFKALERRIAERAAKAQ